MGEFGTSRGQSTGESMEGSLVKVRCLPMASRGSGSRGRIGVEVVVVGWRSSRFSMLNPATLPKIWRRRAAGVALAEWPSAWVAAPPWGVDAKTRAEPLLVMRAGNSATSIIRAFDGAGHQIRLARPSQQGHGKNNEK